MIDNTSVTIEQMEQDIREENERRYAFYRMLGTTDRVLWRLEEMNRDGVKTIPDPLRSQIRESVAELPKPVREVFRDAADVQPVLDSVFDMQESLFRWRDPRWSLDEEDDRERLAG